jgi:hypothetical protein
VGKRFGRNETQEAAQGRARQQAPCPGAARPHAGHTSPRGRRFCDPKNGQIAQQVGSYTASGLNLSIKDATLASPPRPAGGQISKLAIIEQKKGDS